MRFACSRYGSPQGVTDRALVRLCVALREPAPVEREVEGGRPGFVPSGDMHKAQWQKDSQIVFQGNDLGIVMCNCNQFSFIEQKSNFPLII
jgi:hypothetical protein